MWSGSSFCNFKSLPGLVSILSFPILPLLLLSLLFTSIQKAQVMQFMAEAVWSANVRWRDANVSWKRGNIPIHCSSSSFHPLTQIFIIEYILRAMWKHKWKTRKSLNWRPQVQYRWYHDDHPQMPFKMLNNFYGCLSFNSHINHQLYGGQRWEFRSHRNWF